MKFTYRTSGVCSRSIDIELEGNIIKNVVFMGGCHGNLQGIGQLVKGMDIDDVIDRLDDIKCGYKSTSCPAQLAAALKQYKEEN